MSRTRIKICGLTSAADALAACDAGADAIVASLWPVDDRSTKELMTAFYGVPARTDRREALRQAQLAIKADNPHPFAWGAFQFTGRIR